MLGLSVAACLLVPVNTLAQSNDPQPQDATTAILAAFDKYDVVGMNAAHNNKKLDDFILSLIRNRELPGKVNDLVVECGNSRYQAILDRYIAGDPVSLEDARHAWRDTSVGMCAFPRSTPSCSPLYAGSIKRSLPATACGSWWVSHRLTGAPRLRLALGSTETRVSRPS
ncbi:MAG TPA: hypothetical protein VNY05_16475 [Candidatus Acidoferrales bacterium]|jgi:hypothetical protein|nr:hypothetical protein [Candidatus Acidoferrales bacterium]